MKKLKPGFLLERNVPASHLHPKAVSLFLSYKPLFLSYKPLVEMSAAIASVSSVSASSSSSSTSVFADLIHTFVTWDKLKAHLMSEEGGQLRVEDYATAESPYALIRYVKGKSDLSKPHVRAFRSVIWDVREHHPVSITPFKSVDGESLPSTSTADAVPSTLRVEDFKDGVMIGMFWDSYTRRWRIHTRSCLDAVCRYYSQTKTFSAMFWEAFAILTASTGFTLEHLDKTRSYTWVLQHPENRIVCPTVMPNISCVETMRCVDFVFEAPMDARIAVRSYALPTWSALREKLAADEHRFHHNIQGYVVKDLATGQRWKVRTPSYNAARKLRGNSARRDFVWLSAWKAGAAAMHEYFRIYPEENREANTLIQRWKTITNDVFHIYVDAFKARTLERTHIPPKYRPLVYGLHNKYLNELKPAGKSLDWKATLEFMNTRDVPQMLFVVNWDVRQAAKELGIAEIPIEPAAAVGTTVESAADSSAEETSISTKRSHVADPTPRSYAVAAGAATPAAPERTTGRSFVARGPPSHGGPRGAAQGGGRVQPVRRSGPGSAFVRPASST